MLKTINLIISLNVICTLNLVNNFIIFKVFF